MSTFFADTYAIIELLKGSSHYRRYKNAVLVTTEFNLAEFAWAVTRDYPDTAQEICSQVRHGMRLYHPGDRDYLRASHLRRESARLGKKFSLNRLCRLFRC
jgi:predicted nucleic acid-binding protein